MATAGRTTARVFGTIAASVAGLGTLVALAKAEKPCPSSYVHLLPLRWGAIVVTGAIVLLAFAVVAVARTDEPHRLAAALGITLSVAAVLATAATIALAAGGFDSCWTF